MGWIIPVGLAVLLSAGTAAAEELLDGIAAQVGPDIVLISEITQLTRGIEPRMHEMGASQEEISTLRSDVLESLIERRLVEQMVRRAELEVTEAELDETIASIAKENGLSLAQLRASVEGNQLSFANYRDQIRGEIERAKVLNLMVRSRVRVEEAEVRDLYQKRFADQPGGGAEYHLRHIMVPAGRNPSRPCAGAEAALARIRAGESFAEVASKVSVANPESGGNVGWVHSSSLAGWMAPVVPTLEAGATSDVVRTSFGCNLLQLVEVRDYSVVTYAEARPKLQAELFEERFQTLYTEWMESLRAQTFIQRRRLVADASGESGTP